jgi:glutaredoxin
MAKVTLYSKPDCPLCDDARLALERVREHTPFELEEIDINREVRLLARYAERIPVVALDGRDMFDFIVDEEELARALA